MNDFTWWTEFYKHRFEVRDRVKICNLPEDSQLNGVTGTYAGASSPDGYIAIVILDEPTSNNLAVTFPVVCLEPIR